LISAVIDLNGGDGGDGGERSSIELCRSAAMISALIRGYGFGLSTDRSVPKSAQQSWRSAEHDLCKSQLDRRSRGSYAADEIDQCRNQSGGGTPASSRRTGAIATGRLRTRLAFATSRTTACASERCAGTDRVVHKTRLAPHFEKSQNQLPLARQSAVRVTLVSFTKRGLPFF
jgi:hypothetical protein